MSLFLAWGGGGGAGMSFSDMRHPKDCEGDFNKIESLKIFVRSNLVPLRLVVERKCYTY